ncbi:probable LRR receptor-like serine/threonine-protein kinase At1g63430 [Camellia sinensis]|uniref:probable LRR receptor-like serine/threonine-protein kinase At1g63430 n=1 Tax=Camellia sinensis TaxID=4442 RepID=UPI001035D82F|nr:probable LRR receptor-like serine/threonine-protein kinase At1g63430 [Camellia sinensis]
MRKFSSFQPLWVCLGLFLVTCDASALSEVSALYAFKETINEDPLMALSNWNKVDADPCDWSGISCSVPRDHVLKLNITWSSLKGFLSPKLGELSSLQELYAFHLYILHNFLSYFFCLPIILLFVK